MSNYFLFFFQQRWSDEGRAVTMQTQLSLLQQGGHTSRKNVAQVTFSLPIQTVVWHTHGQQERWHRLITIVWTYQKNQVNLFLFDLQQQKEKKKFACVSWKKTKQKTIWVFSLNVKANSTKCFVQQHHKTTDRPLSKRKKQSRWHRKTTVAAAVQTVYETK